MITVSPQGAYLSNGILISEEEAAQKALPNPSDARVGTLAASILRAHSKGDEGALRITFDALISHDITYVGIVQTARASGLTEFPVPYALTNCHNSLCAVGGTINEDDHLFGLSAAKKYGGIYVPANLAVIHQYAREQLAGCGRMILGSDSHTRYGPLGTMGVGEGGPEIVKQLLSATYDIAPPEVVLVYLENAPRPGVGPHDVALALCAAVYRNGFVKNKVLEFAGPGVAGLSMDFRLGIDVMTTETACLSSIWVTDEVTEAYLRRHGRAKEYQPLSPAPIAYYDAVIKIDLARVEPMIALPFHPSNAYPIRTLLENPDILAECDREAEKLFGKPLISLKSKATPQGIFVDQGVIAGCAGGLYDNIAEAAEIMRGGDMGAGAFSLSVYPPSVPVQLSLQKAGVLNTLLEQGALIKPCFCGPCFGAGDVPATGALSIRHTTRNFLNREGSKPGEGQLAAVALMDARSIAATARNGGRLTPATDIEYDRPAPEGIPFEGGAYKTRVYNGFGHPTPDEQLRYGPGIADWPPIPALGENLLMRLASVIHDEVTTTDELIPSGETSSYRSNPMRLASFALSRRDPAYVNRAKAAQALEDARAAGEAPQEIAEALSLVGDAAALLPVTQIGSAIYATRPGDGSAREQAASCQRVLGGVANLCRQYATKRYRSNCINWGLIPFTLDDATPFPYAPDDFIFIPGIRKAVQDGAETIPAKVIAGGKATDITLYLKGLDARSREILLNGCLMNDYAAQSGKGKD